MSAALFVAIGISGAATPVAGALGDRYDRRRVMIVSELAAAARAAGHESGVEVHDHGHDRITRRS
jgi:MFS family permease